MSLKSLFNYDQLITSSNTNFQLGGDKSPPHAL